MARFSALCGYLAGHGHTSEARAVAEQAIALGIWRHPAQRPTVWCPDLPPVPVVDTARVPWVRTLEEAFPEIHREVLSVAPEEAGFTAKSDPIYHGQLDDLHLWRNGVRNEEACKRLPRTAAVFDEISDLKTMTLGYAGISWMMPGTRVVPHCGPTNARTRVHMGIQIPEGVSIRVDDSWHRWREGECLAFDDSFEHEVVHEGTEARAIAVVDGWNPDLDADSIRALSGELQWYRVESAVRELLQSNGLASARQGPDGTIEYVHGSELDSEMRRVLIAPFTGVALDEDDAVRFLL